MDALNIASRTAALHRESRQAKIEGIAEKLASEFPSITFGLDFTKAVDLLSYEVMKSFPDYDITLQKNIVSETIDKYRETHHIDKRILNWDFTTGFESRRNYLLRSTYNDWPVC